MNDLEAIFLISPWLSIGVWLVLYVADYYLTVWAAILYRQGANAHVVFEGSYELTPQFQKDIDGLRRFSPRFLGYVVLSTGIVGGLWYVANRWPDWRNMFLLAYGGLVFRQLAVLVRHARNIALFRRLREHKGVEGRISYSTWLTLEMSWVELLFMALLLLAAAGVAGRMTLYGGAFAVFVTGLEHRKMSKKKLADMKKTQSGQSAPGD